MKIDALFSGAARKEYRGMDVSSSSTRFLFQAVQVIQKATTQAHKKEVRYGDRI